MADLQSLYRTTTYASNQYKSTITKDLEEIQSKFTRQKFVDMAPPWIQDLITFIQPFVPDIALGEYYERLMKTRETLKDVQSTMAALVYAAYELVKTRQGIPEISDAIGDMATQLRGEYPAFSARGLHDRNRKTALFPNSTFEKLQGGKRWEAWLKEQFWVLGQHYVARNREHVMLYQFKVWCKHLEC
ncbi:MAG: hypothetical protein Q9170_006576 [Blastenia crenularia]